jgi:dipeptidyl aminopeptidase/acylaminoacyl peptidase
MATLIGRGLVGLVILFSLMTTSAIMWGTQQIGTVIAYTRLDGRMQSDGQLVIYDHLHRRSLEPPNLIASRVEWSPDGRYIAYIQVTRQDNRFELVIYDMEQNQSQTPPVTGLPLQFVQHVTWADNNDTLILQYRDQRTVSQLALYDLEAGTLTPLDIDHPMSQDYLQDQAWENTYPAPDGTTRLIWEAEADNTWTLYLDDGSKTSTVITGGYPTGEAVWTSNGDYALIAITIPTQFADLYRIVPGDPPQMETLIEGVAGFALRP